MQQRADRRTASQDVRGKGERVRQERTACGANAARHGKPHLKQDRIGELWRGPRRSRVGRLRPGGDIRSRGMTVTPSGAQNPAYRPTQLIQVSREAQSPPLNEGRPGWGCPGLARSSFDAWPTPFQTPPCSNERKGSMDLASQSRPETARACFPLPTPRSALPRSGRGMYLDTVFSFREKPSISTALNSFLRNRIKLGQVFALSLICQHFFLDSLTG